MRRMATMGGALAALWLVLGAFVAPAAAQLGCFRDGSFSAATCNVTADCAAVGGTDCTAGFCACPGAPTAPFCACPVVHAPVLSPAASAGAAVLVAAIGFFSLWRSGRIRRAPI